MSCCDHNDEPKGVKMTYLTCREAAERLAVSIQTVQRMARRGDLPGARKIGSQGATSQWRIPEDALSA